MEAAHAMAREVSSVLIDWTMVLSFFAAQVFVATGGVQSLIG